MPQTRISAGGRRATADAARADAARQSIARRRALYGKAPTESSQRSSVCDRLERDCTETQRGEMSVWSLYGDRVHGVNGRQSTESSLRLVPREERDCTETQRGEISVWFDRKQYGFIKPDNGGGDIIVYKHALKNKEPKPGDRVTFEEHVDNRGDSTAHRVTPDLLALRDIPSPKKARTTSPCRTTLGLVAPRSKSENTAELFAKSIDPKLKSSYSECVGGSQAQRAFRADFANSELAKFKRVAGLD